MNRRRNIEDSLTGALEGLEQLVSVGERFQRVHGAINAITQRRRERARQGLGESPAEIELEEVRPGVYQSVRRSAAQQALEDVRTVRDALRPEVPDAGVVPAGRRRR